MTAYDVRSAATAARMLAPISQGGKGQPVIITKPQAAGTYDPTTGAVTNATPTTQTGSGVVFPYTTFIRSGIKDEAGSLIRAGDQQLLLSPFAADGTPLTPPEANDQAQIGSTTYTITSVSRTAPAGTPIYYECNIRGAN